MNLGLAIKEELKNPLPGKEFHKKMMPLRSPVSIPVDQKSTQAAVAIIIMMSNGIPELILIRRSEYQGYHSGQVSFPGGKADPADRNLLETSIRETSEETGVTLNTEECIGKLTPLFIQLSGFHVRPYVFYIDKEITFHIDRQEVNYMIQVPVKRLLEDDLIRIKLFKFPDVEFNAPYMDIKGEVVWGATSMILKEFIEILKRVTQKYPRLLS